MQENGIGASVRRKEDQRFLLGKGRYTDDINVAGQTHAVFVRSPHAHAVIEGIDATAASAAPGVVAVLTGAELAADGIGPLICGVQVISDDGNPHRAPAHPALAQGKVNYVGDHVAVMRRNSSKYTIARCRRSPAPQTRRTTASSKSTKKPRTTSASNGHSGTRTRTTKPSPRRTRCRA